MEAQSNKTKHKQEVQRRCEKLMDGTAKGDLTIFSEFFKHY